MSKKDEFTFKDLTEYDLVMIRDKAIKLYTESGKEDSTKCLIQTMFLCLDQMGLSVVKDETKTSTWKRPEQNWYAPPERKKNYYE